MSTALSAHHNTAFEIRNVRLPVVHMRLRSASSTELAQEFVQRYGDIPDFFDQDPLLIDLSAIEQVSEVPNFAELLRVWNNHQLVPLWFMGGSEAQRQAARSAGLRPTSGIPVENEKVHQAASVAASTAANAPATPPPSALVVDRPLRSGQQVYAKGRDLVVLAIVNAGAEVIADGHIHVYAPLRGKAIAGARGQTDARIFAQSLEAELISIAGVYRTSDVPLPATVRAKAAQIRLQCNADGERLLIDPIS